MDYKVGHFVIHHQGPINKKGNLKSKWRRPLRIKMIFNEEMNFTLEDKDENGCRTNIREIKKYKMRKDGNEQEQNLTKWKNKRKRKRDTWTLMDDV